MRADTLVVAPAVAMAAESAKAENERKIFDLSMMAIPLVDQKKFADRGNTRWHLPG
jgi:predicted O-linked N-acetylglucosamine transferase (SPINDLY family)